jgi:hypothetical protein
MRSRPRPPTLEADAIRQLREEIMHGRRDPPHSVTAATRRIRHALALAVFAFMSAGISVAQGAPQGLTPASQIARHFQHEDALYQLSERAASFPTPQGLRADGLRWQGIAKTHMQLQGAGLEPTWEHQLHSPGSVSQYPTPAGLKADGLRWLGIARAHELVNGEPTSQIARHFQHEDALYQLSERAASFPTPQGLRADGLRWQGIARAYELVNGERLASTGTGNGFDWGTAGIGFATAIVAMLLAGAGAIARRRTLTKRRGAVAAARP